MALTPTLAYGAAPASPAPAARAGASMDGSSGLVEGASAQISLGFLVLLAILLVTLGGDDDGPNNPTPPVSP